MDSKEDLCALLRFLGPKIGGALSQSWVDGVWQNGRENQKLTPPVHVQAAECCKSNRSEWGSKAW